MALMMAQEVAMTLVKIDRFSIRKNPTAGRTEFLVPGVQHGSISVRFGCCSDKAQEKAEHLIKLMEYEECCMKSYGCENLIVNIDAGLGSWIDANEICDRIKREIDNDPHMIYMSIESKLEQTVNMCRTMTPDPDFLFQYVQAVVECKECHERFDHSELDSDEIDDDTWSDRVCPKCGAFDCCEIEYEELTPELTAVIK